MPEMYNPSANTDEEHLLFGGSAASGWKTWILDHKKGIIGVICGVVLVALIAIVSVELTATKSDVVIPTTPAPLIPTTSAPTSTSTKATTTARSTTTTTTTSKTTTTTPKPTTTTTETTTTSPSTTTTSTTTSTTPKSTTTEDPTTTTTLAPLDPNTTTTFHPTTLKPLPVNVTDYPPVNLLIDMKMRPNFSEIQCLQYHPPTFKFQVTVLDTHTFIGEDQSRKEDAKTSAARVANEELFSIHYPKPMPSPAKYPCNGTAS